MKMKKLVLTKSLIASAILLLNQQTAIATATGLQQRVFKPTRLAHLQQRQAQDHQLQGLALQLQVQSQKQQVKAQQQRGQPLSHKGNNQQRQA